MSKKSSKNVIQLNNKGIITIYENMKYTLTNFNVLMPRVLDFRLDSNNEIEIQIKLTEEEKQNILKALNGSINFTAVSDEQLPLIIFFLNKEFRDIALIKFSISGREQIINSNYNKNVVFQFKGDSIYLEEDNDLYMFLTMKKYLSGGHLDQSLQPIKIGNALFWRAKSRNKGDYTWDYIPISNNNPIIPVKIQNVNLYYLTWQDVEIDYFGVPGKYVRVPLQPILEPIMHRIDSELRTGQYFEEISHKYKLFLLEYYPLNLIKLFKGLNLKNYPVLRYINDIYLRAFMNDSEILPQYINDFYTVPFHFKDGSERDENSAINLSRHIYYNSTFFTRAIKLKDILYISPKNKNSMIEGLGHNIYYVGSTNEQILLSDFLSKYGIKVKKTLQKYIDIDRERENFLGVPLKDLKEYAKNENFFRYAIVYVDGRLMREEINLEKFLTKTGKILTPNSTAFMNDPEKYALVSPLFWYLQKGGLVPDTNLDPRFLVKLLEVGLGWKV
ncbi:MAG: hypothetical protein ACP5T9_03150 [Thermoplasmata archaeon]